MSLDEKWTKDKQPLQPVKNDNLTCRTCSLKTDSTIGCKIYEVKPLKVLKGGACYEYKKQ